MTLSRTTQTLIGISVSICLIAFIAWRVEWKQIIESFRRFQALMILPAAALYLSSFFFRAVRWQVILHALKRISLSLNFQVVMIGWAANNLLPARLGEIVRAYVMGKQAQISKSATLTTIMVERLFDGIILISFLVFIIPYFEFPQWVHNLEFAGIFLFGGVFLFIIIVQKKRAYFINLIRKATSRLSQGVSVRINEFSEKFLHGLDCLDNPFRQILVIFYSLIIWIIEGFTYFIILKGFHIELPLAAAFFCLVIVNVGILIPSSPGYVGAFQFFTILALSLFHVNSGTALSFSLVLHAIQYFPVTILGIIFMNHLGLRWKEIRES